MIMLFSIFIENIMISPVLNRVLDRSLPFDSVSPSIFSVLLLLSEIDCDTYCEVHQSALAFEAYASACSSQRPMSEDDKSKRN